MSSKPVLYYAPRSAPSRSVLLTAAEIGLDLDLRMIIVKKGENRTPEFLKLNPQHTIPVLDDNGTVISDSHVICTYLADKYAKDDGLFPREPVARNKVMTRLFYNCGHIFPRIRSILEPVLYSNCAEIPQTKVDDLNKAYDGLEHCLTDTPYICGDSMTIADLCLIASMSTAHDVAPIYGKLFPNLWAWHERMAALPTYKKWNREGADKLMEVFTESLEENKKALNK